MAKRKARAKAKARAIRPKVTFEFNVLDNATKRRVAQCINQSGKVSVSMVLKGRVANGTGGGFEQKVD